MKVVSYDCPAAWTTGRAINNAIRQAERQCAGPQEPGQLFAVLAYSPEDGETPVTDVDAPAISVMVDLREEPAPALDTTLLTAGRRCNRHQGVIALPVLCQVCNRIAVEWTIANHLVRALLAQGLVVSVFDGEERPIRQSDSPNEVLAAMLRCDIEWLEFYRHGEEGMVYVGNVMLVYGNDGWDVISDYHMSLEPFLASTNALVDYFGVLA